MSQREPKPTAPLAEPLTPREQEVLTLVGRQLTNQQIADELVVAYSTVRWYLRQIYNKLGVSGREEAVERAQGLGLITKPTSARQQNSNLPVAQTPFVGREVELAALGELLLDPHVRLVTVVGPGGIGKTRLALAAAARQVARLVPGSDQPAFPDGVWHVSLAPIQEAVELVPAIAAAVGLEPERLDGQAPPTLRGQLHDYLSQKRLLRFLDNLEHLSTAAPLLAEILANAPQVKLLVASRRRLQMQGEQVFLLGGLELPVDQEGERLGANPAVRLFTGTARRVQRALKLDDGALAAIGRICHLLEGTPLAIELAASWASILPPEKIEREVQRGLDILAAELADVPPRHRSLQATLDASWSRLAAPEQDAFRQLSVFRGGFARQAAREVAGASLQNLRKLIDASWLTRDQEHDRYQVQELLRQYGEGRLERDAELAQGVRERHAAYFAGYLQAFEDEWYGPRQREALDAVQREIDNVRLAWRWAIAQRNVALMTQGIESLGAYYARRGDEKEAWQLFTAASEALLLSTAEVADDIARRRLLARLLLTRTPFGATVEQRRVILNQAESLLKNLRWEQVDVTYEEAVLAHKWAFVKTDRDPEEARPYYLQARSLFGKAGYLPGKAYATLGVCASVYYHLGEYEKSTAMARDALRIHEELGNEAGVATALQRLGINARECGRLDEASSFHRQAYRLQRGLGDHSGTAFAARYLAETLAWSGELREARRAARAALDAAERLGSAVLVALTACAAATVAIHCGRYDRAQQHLAKSFETPRTMLRRRATGFRFVYAGQLSLVQGQLEESIEQQRRAASDLIEYQDNLWMLPLVFEAYARQRLRQTTRSRELLAQALRENQKKQVFLIVVNALPIAAELLAYQGERERAVELYALACRYPYVANSRWFADLFAADMAALVSSLPSAEVSAALERGRARDLWETAAEVIAAFDPAAA